MNLARRARPPSNLKEFKRLMYKLFKSSLPKTTIVAQTDKQTLAWYVPVQCIVGPHDVLGHLSGRAQHTRLETSAVLVLVCLGLGPKTKAFRRRRPIAAAAPLFADHISPRPYTMLLQRGRGGERRGGLEGGGGLTEQDRHEDEELQDKEEKGRGGLSWPSVWWWLQHLEAMECKYPSD